MPDQRPALPKHIQVNADPKDLKGRYVNAFSVTSQEREVVIDFLSHVHAHGLDQAQLVGRIFLNRFTAQDLITELRKNMANWENMRYEQTNQDETSASA
ncbi:DUF3467 domain-containing protein [Patescibacteria group bacterium]|nr:DUF3467 domain-containing protein [Patescibacteria group bacterium]MBU1448816.1 DUF3467 domain-containing protein [Patescibacteria group bacterium]MBU2613076.1 DUF3467 domain-containing protein [Patescibacteria group bacterium]